ncbi:ATP-binding protein [Bremerella sp. JC817]|uniref:sensor histidine kinase n=1 Tax=Bremerella sp. JC817 TaxID=3231756 RepID=UPI00345B445F
MLHLVGSILSQIGSFFFQLFDTNGFPARWDCGSVWAEEPGVGWLHIVSDLAIFGAYLAIPICLAYFLIRRRDLPFPTLVILFAMFIVSCGVGHLVEAIIFWEPVYRFSGLIKLITAVASWATVIALVPLIPRILDLPSLYSQNQSLEEQVIERTATATLFRSVFSAVPNGIIVVDREGVMKLVNIRVCEMFGYTDKELAGKPVEVLIPHGLRDRHVTQRNAYFNVPTNRKMGEGRYLEGIDKNGRCFPVEVGLSPTQIAGGLHVIVSIVDITERKNAENELMQHARRLEKTNQDLDEFAYVASHDLRSPLQGVKNLASWIRDDNEGNLPEESLRHLDLMQQRIGRLERLLDDLLQYSRVGRIRQSIVQVDVAELLNNIIDSLPRPEGLRVEVATEMPVLETPMAPLDLVFRNLIQNAIKHHDRKDGMVVISSSDEGYFYQFSVRDDGPGIATEFHERIFKMFETLAPRDDVEGSGMGLSIVKKAVENIGGKIWVESEPEEGATFTFVWPKTAPQGGQE